MTDTKKENRVKLYGVILGIITALLQHSIYLGGYKLAGIIGNTSFLPKIDAIDGLFPVVSVFIIPYVWSYLYWAMAPMAVSKCKKDHFYNYLATYALACIVGAIILSFAPTYMDRVAEGLMDTSKTDWCSKLMRFWYSIDGGDMAYNLFPSFHCINSTVSFLGVYKREEVPKWYRVYSLIITVTIYFSTLFVKQHYVLDVVAGITIGIIAYIVCEKFNLGRVFYPADRFFSKLFHKKTEL